MQEIKIDDEFRALIPPLTTDERAQLEENLTHDGCRDPLVVWRGLLVDGHNRFEICRKNRIEFSTKELTEISSRELVQVWIIRNQFGRRNLSHAQRAELALKLEPLISLRAKENLIASGGDKKSGLQKSVDPIEKFDTQKELAKIAGVSHDTIHKMKTVLAKGDDETVAAVRAGETTVNAAYKDIKSKSRPQPETETPADPRHKETDPPTKSKRQGVGIIRANEAIDILKRIPKADEFRDRAFQMVKDWIKEHH